MKTLPVIFASLLSVAAVGQAVRNRGPNRTWIADVSIISPERLDHIQTGSVLIEGGRIIRVERRTGAKMPAGATMVSGKRQFLIPGLIDSHVHLASVPGMRPETGLDPPESQPEMVRKYFKQLPRSYLYFGYTTLIDLAVVNRRVLDDFRQVSVRPDLYDCGPSLPVANGYPMSFAPPRVRFKVFSNFLYDTAQTSRIPAEYKPEDHTPAATVAVVKQSGGICVKTYFERGFAGDTNLPVMGSDVLAEIRKAASQAGLVLIMHANSFEAQKFAVEGDVHAVAHGMWNWGELTAETELPPAIASLLDRIVQKRIGYQPTIQVMQGLRAYFDPEYLNLKTIRNVVPAEMLEWFQSSQGKWFKPEIAGKNAPPDAVVLQGFENGPLRRVRQVVAYLAGKDADFLFGTDTPSAPTYGNLPGLNGYLEMRQLQIAGLSLKQIFQAATINNARKFKLDSQLGTVEPGKIANLVILKKSPLESLDAYDSIVTVWVHGTPASRNSLAANSIN